MQDINTKYGLKPAHSEVVAAVEQISPGYALDMGCSNGRNALYLAQKGFKVKAVDINTGAINSLQHMAEEESLDNLVAEVYDINEANLNDEFDFIACTVTLMFLQADVVPDVIADMQKSTKSGGYNLIVCAMDTAANPTPFGFPFTFDEGELKQAYQGWELIKYNEDLGTMHNGAKLQFATMLAKKP